MLKDVAHMVSYVFTSMTCSWVAIRFLSQKYFLDSSLRKNFAVGSEDKNDIMFVGQRIKWKIRNVLL